MGRPRSSFALLACVLVLCAVFLAHVATATAGDVPNPGLTQQTDSNSATASATNDSSTSQSSTQTQTGGGTGGGQSQSTVQSADTSQNAGASASSTQAASNVGTGAAAPTHQENTNTAVSSATNSSSTDQKSQQNQTSAGKGSSGAGQSQTATQSAPTEQHADSSADSTQVAPTNVNVVVRIDSPGNDGAVTQTNSSTAVANAGNVSGVAQSADQTQTGGAGGATGQLQSAAQSAPTTQQASSLATSTQVNPLNLNIVVRNKSPGDEAPVTQTNTSQATANGSNTSAVTQGSNQLQTAGGSSGGQTQIVRQDAPVSQSADATATSVQTAPTNLNIAVTVDPSAADPSGSGLLGTLIQIWIPRASTTTGSTQPAASTAAATAVNLNTVTQTATQSQDGGASPTHVGGSGQTQIVTQSAPVTQVASASAVGQTADQSQQGGDEDVQIVLQDTAGQPGDDATLPAGPSDGWVLVAPATLLPLDPRSHSSLAHAAASGRSPSRSTPSSRRSVPRGPQAPLPSQAPAALGAASGGASGSALWVFAALIAAFLLAAPWWARRQPPSVVRRLAGVVSRLERPG